MKWKLWITAVKSNVEGHPMVWLFQQVILEGNYVKEDNRVGSKLWRAWKQGFVPEKIGIVWLDEKLWILVGMYINELSFKWHFNHLNPSFVDKVMSILLELRRFNQN